MDIYYIYILFVSISSSLIKSNSNRMVLICLFICVVSIEFDEAFHHNWFSTFCNIHCVILFECVCIREPFHAINIFIINPNHIIWLFFLSLSRNRNGKRVRLATYAEIRNTQLAYFSVAKVCLKRIHNFGSFLSFFLFFYLLYDTLPPHTQNPMSIDQRHRHT